VEDSNNKSDEDDEKKIKQRLFGDDDDDDESSGIGSAKEMVDDDDVTGSSRNPREAITLDLELKETKPLDGRQVYLLKVPNFLHFDPRPFDADTFEGESGEEEDQEGLRQRIKLKVDNTVRWRFRNSKGSKQLSLVRVKIISIF
jgi:hypothetical protein